MRGGRRKRKGRGTSVGERRRRDDVIRLGGVWTRRGLGGRRREGAGGSNFNGGDPVGHGPGVHNGAGPVKAEGFIEEAPSGRRFLFPGGLFDERPV